MAVCLQETFLEDSAVMPCVGGGPQRGTEVHMLSENILSGQYTHNSSYEAHCLP